MIDLKYIDGFFPEPLRANPAFSRHIIKEYIQLMVLDYLSATPYIKKMAFIGGTNLRLVKGIDRFSEDLDFDVRGMSEQEFMNMTDDILSFLRRSGLNVEARDKQNARLTGHKEERFLLKIEAQDQGVPYEPKMVNVSGCGFFFPLPVPPDDILLSMKLSALLTRAKGRDFYDVMFLFSQTEPNYAFLEKKAGIGNLAQLKAALHETLAKTDLNVRKRDFGHLLFSERNAERILRFGDFINEKQG